MKYKIPKSELSRLYAIIDMEAKSVGYWKIYEHLGEVQDSNKNFFCFNSEAHSDGVDKVGSLQIFNDNGSFKCHACGVKGNFNIYYKNYHNSEPGAYTEFMIDYLGLHKYLPNNDADEKNIQQMKKLYEAVQMKYEKSFGKVYVSSDDFKDLEQEDIAIPIELNNKYVKSLLGNKKITDYLLNERGISKHEIDKFRIGFCEEKKCITFPILNSNGKLVNIKGYAPWNKKFKWIFFYKGNPINPTPFINLTNSKIYIFEGEPDAYCAISSGFNSVTFGSAGNADVYKYFSTNDLVQIFGNKEIVICMDCDEAGRKAAVKLANQLHQFVKQIKIIDLDKREGNEYGLDPNKLVSVNGKNKRVEKDFTDFMKKNGFEANAVEKFKSLEKSTKVYNINVERKPVETYKVTLQEARSSKYFNGQGKIKLELVGCVSDWDSNSYKYPEEFIFTCGALREGKAQRKCGSCSIPTMKDFGKSHVEELTFKIVREKTGKDANNPYAIKCDEHNILGMIETKDSQKLYQMKKLAKIHTMCNEAEIVDKTHKGLMHVVISRDISESVQTYDNGDKKTSTADFSMDAYTFEKDLQPNKSYKINAIQTTSWNTGHAVLFVDNAVPLETSIDRFKMNNDVAHLLKMFRPREGESIQECLDRRYEVFSGAAGINGREDLILIMDLAFFGQTIIHNPQVLPGVPRGWVEILVAGDSRCGKSIIAKFLHKHYKMGELVGGSSAVTRTGLIGGIKYFKNKATIKWGKFPQNDHGLIIIDEFSTLSQTELSDMNFLRSDGAAVLGKIESGSAPARLNKIFLSNDRSWKTEDKKSYLYGIEMLKDLCYTDMVLARFDIATVVKQDDVVEFNSRYEQISTEFTEYQCQNLIKWGYSRTHKDIEFEDGISELLNEKQKYLLTKFHRSTQLINQEMRAKLIRLSTSLATMLFSTYYEDYNKLYVKKEHVEYISNFLENLYSNNNIGLKDYSELKWKSENLGDMTFMKNILKYVNVDSLLTFSEGTEKDICSYFMDYLIKVMDREMYIPLSNNDNEKKFGMKLFDLQPRFISLLSARNCIKKTRRGRYMKTEQFNRWLKGYINDKEKDDTNILEVESDKRILKNADDFRPGN